MKKTRKEKTYAVDIHWDVAKCLKVTASNADDAEKKVWMLIEEGKLSPDVKGWEITDDVEVECSGEEGKDGTIEYH